MQTVIYRFGQRASSFGRSILNGIGPFLFPLLALFVMSNAWADLPAPIDPESGAADDGNYIQYFKFTVKDILLIGALVISTVSFLIVSISAFMKFNEARRDRAEWGEVFTLVGIGAFLLVASGFLLNQTLEIIV